MPSPIELSPARRISWKGVAAGALAAFALAALALTGVELVSGHTLSGDEGTTISQVSDSGQTKPTAHPDRGADRRALGRTDAQQ